MSNQIRGLLFYFSTHMKRAFIIFWSILLAILVISLVASYILKNQDGFMTFSISIPIYFFCTVYGRSEEHTSELQSRGHLVCRLLLEKKKHYNIINTYV